MDEQVRFTPVEIKELLDSGELTAEDFALLHPQDAKVAQKLSTPVPFKDGTRPATLEDLEEPSKIGGLIGLAAEFGLANLMLPGVGSAFGRGFTRGFTRAPKGAAPSAAPKATKSFSRAEFPPGATSKTAPARFKELSNKFAESQGDPAAIGRARTNIEKALDAPKRRKPR